MLYDIDVAADSIENTLKVGQGSQPCTSLIYYYPRIIKRLHLIINIYINYML